MNKYFAIINGYEPGIYETWTGPAGAQRQVVGYPDALLMSFSTFEEAKTWHKQQSQTSGLSTFQSKEARDQAKYKRRIEAYQKAGRTIIYVSSSISGNGREGRWGIFIDHPSEPKSYSGYDSNVNSYNFDLVVTKMALQNASEHKGAVIAMDYNLVAEAFGKGWPFKWRINGWKRNNGASPKGVKHWVEILELYESSEPVLLVKPAYASISGHKRAKSMAMKETKPARSSKSYTMNSKRKRRKMKNKMKRSRNIYSSNPQRSYSA